MESKIFKKGIAKRRKVLGDEYVDKALASADELGADMQKLVTEYAWGEVWNKENHRLTRVFEYESEKAYKDCQKIIEEKVVPKVGKNYNTKYRNNRGIVLHDYRS